MGFGCLSIALHEVVKLLHYAEATDVSLIRMGTSGGLGVEPGNVILTKNGYDATLQEGHEVTTVGKKTRFPSPSGEITHVISPHDLSRYHMTRISSRHLPK